jgi:F-type H+-transporting ATPase subunit delta
MVLHPPRLAPGSAHVHERERPPATLRRPSEPAGEILSEPISVSTGIADRYATAVFELAQGDGGLDGLERDVDALSEALGESEDLRRVIRSPIYSRAEQEAAIGAVAGKIGLSETMTRTLRLMATKRRLFVLPQLLTALRHRLADARGEVTAEVVSASPLSDEQRRRLAETLKQQAGRDVRIDMSVDEGLIGGMRVRLGSKMIDTSIRSKLDAIQNMMREAG